MGAEHVRKSHPEWFQTWWTGQEKVVVKVSGIKELDEVKEAQLSWDFHGLKSLMRAIHKLHLEPQLAYL